MKIRLSEAGNFVAMDQLHEICGMNPLASQPSPCFIPIQDSVANWVMIVRIATKSFRACAGASAKLAVSKG